MQKSQQLPHHPLAPKTEASWCAAIYYKVGRRKSQLLILISLIVFALVSYKILSVVLTSNDSANIGYVDLQLGNNINDDNFSSNKISLTMNQVSLSESPKVIDADTNYDTSNVTQLQEIQSEPNTEMDMLESLSSTDADVHLVMADGEEEKTTSANNTDQLPSTITTTTSTTRRATTLSSSPSPPPKANETIMACQLPKLNPFDPSIMHLVEKPDPVHCPTTSEFPFVLLTKSTLNSTLLVTQKRTRNGPDLNDLERDGSLKSCYYKTLTRGDDPEDIDNSYKISEERFPLHLQPSSISVIPPEHEYLVIYCDIVKKSTGIFGESGEDLEATTEVPGDQGDNNPEVEGEPKEHVYSKVVDMHLLIPEKPNVESRINKYYDQLSLRHKSNNTRRNEEAPLPEDDRVNVVIFGIDAVSHMEFIRTMPRTYSFLMNNLSAVEMQGFNKIGDNTYPNLAAVLTPHNKSTLGSTCEEDYYFDKCPFIWKKFAESGYRTSFAEDSPWMSAFNYMKLGFQTPPTDYYLRPFLVAAEDLIGSEMSINANLCYGSRLTFEVMLDYLRQMAGSMGHDKRYFQFIWATGLTHDYQNYGMLGDAHLLSTLKWFQKLGYFNRTVFMLMSDHGIRWGDIHEYLQGQLEERLPFLYFVVPSWFQKKYARAYKNLKLIQDRLTTPFDLHETLLDLMDLRRLNEGAISYKEEALIRADKLKRLPRGISQFLPIPLSRTCEMAEIEGHYCSCHRLQEVNTSDPEVGQAANFLVYQLNVIVSEYPQCGFLTLVSIRTANKIDFGFDVNEWEGGTGYELAVKTRPGNGVFSASIVKNDTGSWRVSGQIGRTNLYGNQSHCVNEKELKLYCYCADLIIRDDDEKEKENKV